jgi:inner membrane transporter RhtA
MGGLQPVLIAIVMQALSNGLLSGNLTGGESLLLSFTAFSLSALVFGLLARLKPAVPYESAFRGPRLRLLITLNVATAVTFLGFYCSLSLIPAPLAAAVETGIGPLAAACYRLRSRGASWQRRELVMGMAALALAVAAAGRTVSVGQIGSLRAFTAGVLMAGIAGVSATGIAVLSHRLGRLEVSPVRVTAHRFHLTYLLALAALLIGPGPGQLTHPDQRTGFVVLVAVGGATIPLFLLQVGMQRTAPMTVTLLASAVPGLTYLAATVCGGQAFDPVTCVMVNGSLAVAFLGPRLIRRAPVERSATGRCDIEPVVSLSGRAGEIG